MPRTRLWIDGDRLVRRFISAAEAQVRDSFTRNVHAQEEKTVLEMNTYLAGLQQRFAAPPPVIVFSDPAHFRRRLFPDYQAYSHFDTQGSVLHRGLVQYLRRNMTCDWYAGMESADVLGVLTTAANPENLRRLRVSSHPLMQTVPGEWLEMSAGDPQTVTRLQADLAFYRYVLLGYAVDNYEGCPGMTPDQADRLLGKFAGQENAHREHPEQWHRQAWGAVLAAYKQAGKMEDDALLCARLARVLRFEDYDFKKKEVKFWNPPAPATG